MGAWLESYNRLTVEQQDRVQKWLHLNKFIARTLRIDWEKWVDDFLTPAMEHPLDYSFMKACIPDFSGFDGAGGAGVAFSRDVDPATAQTARVPLRAKNNLGRLSAELQDAIAALLASEADGPVQLVPADVALLQKILSNEKTLAQLKRKHFRAVEIAREEAEIVLRVKDGEELVRQSVVEFGTVMRKAWV